MAYNTKSKVFNITHDKVRQARSGRKIKPGLISTLRDEAKEKKIRDDSQDKEEYECNWSDNWKCEWFDRNTTIGYWMWGSRY